MQIMIKLSKDDWTLLKHNSKKIGMDYIFDKAIELPEHHGDLIDVNVLKNNIHYVPLAPIFQGDYVTYRNVIFADILDMLPTIIEADKRSNRDVTTKTI